MESCKDQVAALRDCLHSNGVAGTCGSVAKSLLGFFLGDLMGSSGICSTMNSGKEGVAMDMGDLP